MVLPRSRPLPPWSRLGPTLVLIAGLASAVGSIGCATYSDDLQRGVSYYKDNQHERSLAVFRALEPDIDSLKPDDRVRYYYYRGMTDYRLISDKYDVSADARHWLGLAKAAEAETPASLTEKEMGLLNDALDKLNRKIYGIGDADEDVTKKKAAKDDDEAEPKKKSKDKDADDDEKKPKKKKKSDDLRPRRRGPSPPAPSSRVVGSVGVVAIACGEAQRRGTLPLPRYPYLSP